MLDIRPIRTEADHARALAEIQAFDDDGYVAGTDASDRLDVLVTLVAAYEAEHHPVPGADPVSVLQFAIDGMGRSQADLARLLGSASRASEILNRRRPLTLEMIRTISAAWNIPRDALSDAYALVRGGNARTRRSAARDDRRTASSKGVAVPRV